MNELVVPPAPHWYRSSVVACSPDNTLVYGSKNDVVVIREKSSEEPTEVKLIHGAHTKSVISISLNKKWKDPHAYAASLGEDNVIKVWNLETFEKKISNKDHTEHKDAVIGAVFAGDDRIVSASSTGLVIVWNINTNESRPLRDLFKTKVTLTCLSSCPHVGWLLAFGLGNGGVIVADLRRTGQVLYKLRGHYQAVVSLSWCPTPVNIFPKSIQNVVKNKSQEASVNSSNIQVQGGDEQSDTKNEDFNSQQESVNVIVQDDGEKSHLEKGNLNLENETPDRVNATPQDEGDEKDSNNEDPNPHEESANKIDVVDDDKEENKSNNDNLTQKEGVKDLTKSNKLNPWVNLVHADDGEIPLEKEHSVSTGDQDFLTECNHLKTKILGLDVQESENQTQINLEDETVETHTEPKSDVEGTEEKQIDRTGQRDMSHKLDNDRPLPKLFDPSGDFLDDSVADSICLEETILEDDKDTGTEKNKDQTIEIEEKKLEDENTVEKHIADVELNGEDSGIVNDVSPGEIEQTEIVEEEPRTEYLLASSGKDRSVYIWRAGTDGRMQTFFHSPKRANRRDKHTHSWVAVCWVAPDTLLTSSPSGELLSWHLPKPKESNRQYKVVHYEHSSFIFNIVTPPKYMSAYNWRDKFGTSVWSWGQEGRLVNFDLDEDKIRHSYMTVTANVTCFHSSVLDPNRLAIGLRDGGLRVWDLSLPHLKIVTMQKYQQKFTHKVSAIAWHPLKEMILGFGTEEGRVGFIDMIPKKTTLFPHYFRNQVYKVEWGPICGNTNYLGLYVVSEGKMAIYDMKKSNEEPIQLELPKKLYVYKFAWKPDFSLLLLNGKDGSLVILKTDLVAITTFYPNEKGLNAIVWHTDAFTKDTTVSPRCNWLAATTTKGLQVYDFGSIEENDNFADKIVVVFEGHVRPTLSLAWCPFDGDKIVSTAADGLAHVWDVSTKMAIATFVDTHLSNNIAVVWSPSDPDLIIMGDRLIRIWNVSKNPPKTDEEFLTARRRLLGKIAKPEPDKKSDKSKIRVEIPKIKINAKNCIVPAYYVSNDENICLQVDNMRKLMMIGENATLFESGHKSLDPLQLFGTKEHVSQLLEANYDQQKKDNRHKSCELISLWKGNVCDYVQNAINENRVTPTIISIAPMVSAKLWQDACAVYAKKLSEDPDSNPLETAMYFLTCHKVEEAINCLCLSSMFKEALALAKHRLPENSELITKVTEKWAEHCLNTGNFENAAYCYISIKEYENAAKALARRNHIEFLEFAAELAEKGGNKGLHDSIKFKCSELQNALQNGSGVKQSEENVPTRVNVLLKNISEIKEDKCTSESDVSDGFQNCNEDEETGLSISVQVIDVLPGEEATKETKYHEEVEGKL